MELTDQIFILVCIALFLNIFGGMWRYYTKKRSFKWFTAIHLPVLCIIGARLYMDIPFIWYSVVLTVSFSVIGQLSGSLISSKLFSKNLT